MQYDWDLILKLMTVIELAPKHPGLAILADAARSELLQLLAGEHPSQNQEDE